MKDNKGQALVEFILIIPVFALILFGLIDFGNIIYKKITLQNDLGVVVDLYKNNDLDNMYNYMNNNRISLETTSDNQFLTLTIKKNVNLITPGISNLFSNPYVIEESLTIIDE